MALEMFGIARQVGDAGIDGSACAFHQFRKTMMARLARSFEDEAQTFLDQVLELATTQRCLRLGRSSEISTVFFMAAPDRFLCKALPNAIATISLVLCDQIKWQLEDVRDFFQSCGCSFSPTTFQVGNVTLPDVGLVRDVELRLTTPFAKCP